MAWRSFSYAGGPVTDVRELRMSDGGTCHLVYEVWSGSWLKGTRISSSSLKSLLTNEICRCESSVDWTVLLAREELGWPFRWLGWERRLALPSGTIEEPNRHTVFWRKVSNTLSVEAFAPNRVRPLYLLLSILVITIFIWISILGLLFASRKVREGLLVRHGRCVRCGYQLVGLPNHGGYVVCPECGGSRRSATHEL